MYQPIGNWTYIKQLPFSTNTTTATKRGTLSIYPFALFKMVDGWGFCPLTNIPRRLAWHDMWPGLHGWKKAVAWWQKNRLSKVNTAAAARHGISSFFSGGLKAGGDSICLCLTGELSWPPRRPPWTACVHFRYSSLSTSLTSVSVCCYSRYLSRWFCLLCLAVCGDRSPARVWILMGIYDHLQSNKGPSFACLSGRFHTHREKKDQRTDADRMVNLNPKCRWKMFMMTPTGGVAT